MADAHASPLPHEGQVRWRRFGVLLLVGVTAAMLLIALTARGVLAAQFAISGQPFTVTANTLSGTGFEQFGVLDNMAGTADTNPNFGTTGGQELLITSAFKSATLSNLCMSAGFGGVFLKITATSASANTLITDSDSMSGDSTFTNISIGQDPSTFTEVPGVTGPLGTFGQQADSVTINNFRQDNFATTAATFTLHGMSLTFVPTASDGSGGC